MGLDFGIYEAFRQKPMLDRKIAAKQQESDILSQFNQKSEKDLQTQVAGEQAINKARAAFDEVKGLQRDTEALQGVIQQQEQSIIEGISKSGGDAKRYLNTGGISSLKEYQSNILRSDEMSTLMVNKDKQKQYFDALSKGEMALPTAMEVDGKQVIMDFGEQMSQYEDGKLDSLSWRGAQKAVQIDPLAVARIPNPKNPRVSALVTVAEYQGMLIAKGQDPLLAQKMAQAARSGKTNNTTLRWGVDRSLLAADRRASASRKTNSVKNLDFLDFTTNLKKNWKLLKGNPLEVDFIDLTTGKQLKGKNARVGDRLRQKGIFDLKIDGPKKFAVAQTMFGVDKDARSINVDNTMRFNAAASGKGFRISPGMENRFRLRSFDIVGDVDGEYIVNKEGGLDDTSQANTYQTKASMGFEVSPDDIESFVDDQGNPIADIGWFMDDPNQGFQNTIKKLDNGNWLIKAYSDIDYSVLEADAIGTFDVNNQATRATFVPNHIKTR